MPQPSAESTIAALRSATHPTRQYLGDPAIIDALLREYGKAVGDRIDEYVAGRIPRDDALTADIAGAEALARILTGGDPGYQPMGTWTTGGGLADFLRARLGIEETDPADTVAAALLNYATGIWHAYGLLQRDPASDWKGALDDNLQTFGHLLLGLREAA